MEILQKHAGREPGGGGEGEAQAQSSEAAGQVMEVDAGAQEALDRVADYYHASLKQTPRALRYLEERGLCSSEMVEHFKLGYADRSLSSRIPMQRTIEGVTLRGKLREVGVLRTTGHEHFRGSLVIPIHDEQGHVVEMYGRKITKGLRAGTPDHLYLPGPHRGVWNAKALEVVSEVILCESLIDALTFWCAGFRNVTTSYGIEGFTKEHLAAFKRHDIKRVLIAYDRDEAGDKAAEALAAKLFADGMECYRIQFPHQMDANEYALKVQPAERSLDLLIRKAPWLGKGQAPDREAEPVAKTQDLVEEPAATPVPSPPPPAIPAEVKEQEIVIKLGSRRWRVRGKARNTSYEQLKVNLLVGTPKSFHVDTVDLYSARHRAAFIKQAACELGLEERVVKKDLGKVLLKLEQLQDEQIKKTLEPRPRAKELGADERKAALELLEDPQLLDRILEDFERSGVVGEKINKLVGYLAAVSRKLDKPLGVIIQSSSAAGKSSLMEAILAFVPDEDRTKYSAMTGQSLFYMGETDLKHKVLAIVEEEGAERASYALKLLNSEGELAIASTGKDPQTGRLETQEYRVEGPVMIFLTTTAIEVDEELLNRCVVLSVDEDREQTRAIHRLQRQRKTLQGQLQTRDRERLTALHKNAQKLLRPMLVANPYAEQLTFLDDKTRTRRDHMKYLTLIESIALLHQYQREVRRIEHHGQEVEYIEVTLDDIAVANELAHQVLGRSLDELPPQTRRLLGFLDELVAERCRTLAMDRSDYRFTRREVREHTGMGNTQLKVHLARLVELEYVLVHHGSHGQSFVYELLYESSDQGQGPFLPGLLDVATLGCTYDEKWSGPRVSRSGLGENLAWVGRPLVGPRSGGGRLTTSHIFPSYCDRLALLLRLSAGRRSAFSSTHTGPVRDKCLPLCRRA